MTTPRGARAMNVQGKKVLVTGADGFIGSHLVEELVRCGSEVRAMALYNSFNQRGWLDRLPEDTLGRIEVLPSDVRDPNLVRQAMQGRDVVFHLAALTAIPYSYHAPDMYVDTNIRGTLNVLQAARDLRTCRLVHTSTSEVYGTARFVPITEDHPLQGQSPYSATKIAADQLALSFHRSFDLAVSIIRPFNVYGPRQSTRAVIPTVVTQIASGSKAVQLGSLHPTRDFTYVGDTVRGFVAVAECDEAVGEVINVGSNFEISIGDLVALIAEVMGAVVDVHTEDVRIRPHKSEVERLWADNSKAKALAGWEPAYEGGEGMVRGLKETVAWFTDPENLKLYQPGIYHL